MDFVNKINYNGKDYDVYANIIEVSELPEITEELKKSIIRYNDLCYWVKNGEWKAINEETDPTVPQHVKDITQEDIEKWNNGTGGTGGTSDYNDLKNKPKINDVDLEGNKSLDDLGIQPKGDFATKDELNTKASITDMTNYIEEHKEELKGAGGTVIQEEEPTDDAVIWVDTDEDGEVFEEDVFKKEMETYCANYIDEQITQAIGGAY